MTRNKLAICSIFGVLLFGGLVYSKYFKDSSDTPSNTSVQDQSASTSPHQPRSANQEVVDRFRALQAREREFDRTIWADEMLAQEYEQVFIDMWDAMCHSTNWLSVLSNMSFD